MLYTNPLEAEIRAKILRLRRSLTSEERETLSLEAVAHFLRVSGFKLGNGEAGVKSVKPLKVGIYKALSWELNLHALEQALRGLGCQIYFPRVVDLTLKTMDFVEVTPLSAASEWKKGAFGVPEPPSDCPVLDPRELDTLFVPGVAFGEAGQRIGMGEGYYDRFLIRAPQALRVALAFDFQVLPELPQKSTDQPVHWVVTEKREFRLKHVKYKAE